MKILKESNEKLPIQFVTDFVSEGWVEVGKLKGEIEAIKGFRGSEAVADILQKLTDSYLVCIGQLEAFLQDKKYIKEPDELKEAVDIHIDGNEVTVSDASGEAVGIIPIEPEAEEEGSEDMPPAIAEIEPIVEPEVKPEVKVDTPVLHDRFEYFVDFDDIDPNDQPISDAEIEQLQKAGR